MWSLFVACIVFLLFSAGLKHQYVAHIHYYSKGVSIKRVLKEKTHILAFTCQDTPLAMKKGSMLAILEQDRVRTGSWEKREHDWIQGEGMPFLI